MTTIQGPAIFLAQFIGDQAPFNSLDGICKWASDLGFKGIQMPTLDTRFIDLQKAAESKTFIDGSLVNNFYYRIINISRIPQFERVQNVDVNKRVTEALKLSHKPVG